MHEAPAQPACAGTHCSLQLLGDCAAASTHRQCRSLQHTDNQSVSGRTYAKRRHMQAERSCWNLLFVKSPPWIMKLGMTPACSSRGWAF